MSLFKSKRDIPDEEIYRPGDRYFDPELVKSSDLMRRWSDLYNAHEASTHVVEEGYTAEIAVVGTLYDTFYMTGDIDVPGAVEMCFTPEQIREHPEYVTYNAFIPPHQLGYTMDEVDTSRTHCSVVNYVAVPEGYSVALGQDGRLHLYDPQDNVCCVTMPKMFQPWFDIESPMGHIGTQARRRYLVSTRSPFEDVGHAAHRFAERDDPETGERMRIYAGVLMCARARLRSPRPSPSRRRAGSSAWPGPSCRSRRASCASAGPTRPSSCRPPSGRRSR